MKLHFGSRDGGPESRVFMYGIESKRLGSLLLLRFENGSRESYHSHAFEAWSLLLRGFLFEQTNPERFRPGRHWYRTGAFIRTHRETFHRVTSTGRSWVLSVRGPWAPQWAEYDPTTGKYIGLTHGRRVA